MTFLSDSTNVRRPAEAEHFSANFDPPQIKSVAPVSRTLDALQRDEADLLTVLGFHRAAAWSDLMAVLRDARNARDTPVKSELLATALAIAAKLESFDTHQASDRGRIEHEIASAPGLPHRPFPAAIVSPLASEGAVGRAEDRHAMGDGGLEALIDREAFLRAQNDVLHTRLERTAAALRSTRDDLERTKRQHKDEINRLRTDLDQAKETRVSDVLDQKNRVEARLDETTRWRRLLGRAVRDMGRKLDRAETSIRLDVLQGIRGASESLPHLNLDLLAAKVGKAASNRSGVERHMRLIAESRLFHPEYYRNQFSRPLPQGTDLLHHYVTRGWLAGANPNPLFGVQFYLMRNPSLVETGTEPLGHYIESGSAQLRDPHPVFVARHYASLCGGEPGPGETWLRRFLRLDLPSCSPHPLFDPVAYAKRAGLPENHAAVAILHYLLTGWKNGLPFSVFFDTEHYTRQLGEHAVSGEPYSHYVLLGAPNGLDPHPLFDMAHYLAARPGLNPESIDPLVDFVTSGETEGASPNPLFDPGFYRKRFMASAGGMSALEHYLSEGIRAGHDPHPDFDVKAYQGLAKRAADDQRSPLEHFLRIGRSEIDWTDIPDLTEPKAPPPPVVETRPVALQVSALAPRHYPGKAKVLADRPTVLLVAHAAGEHLFGSERSFLDMLDGLSHVPVNVCVALPRNVPAYTNAIRAFCRDVYVFDYRWWRKDETPSLQARETFRTIIADHRIEAVHVNTIMLREALEAARDCNVPGIVHVRELIGHDAALQDLIGHPPDDIIAETKRRSDWIIGNSAATAATFLKQDRTFVIPNPIDLAAMDLPPRKPDGFIRFGLISSNIPKKGLLDVVKLARLVAESAPTARFAIIGPETDLVRELKHQQEDGDVPASVEFPGYAASPREAIAGLDVVLSFSHFAESFGRTVLEAMAARRPVIGYEWGAVPELIRHGETGYLVPFRKPELAVAAVEELCRDPARLADFGERGRAVAVARFGLETYRESFARAYSTILPPDRPKDAPVVKTARRPGLKTVETVLKLAYFCWHFPVPSETFVLSELEQLVRQGVDVMVFCRQSPHKTFKPGFDIPFERVDSPARLAQRLRETGRTMVHAHFTYPTVTDMVWPACEEAGVPFTFMAHAQDIFRHSNDKKNRLAEIGASPWCRALFTLSRFHFDFVAERGFPRDKIVINPNAVDTARFATATDPDRAKRRTRRIVAVHRFVEKKGLDLLIEAAALIRDLDVRVELFGYGEREAAYRQRIADLDLSNVLVGGALTQAEVVETMRHADLFACPSVRTEDGDMDGIPTSIVESMAAGLPVLTTDISGIPDLVTDEITGIVARPTPESIAAAIRRFYAMPELKVEAIIEKARERAACQHDAGRAVRVLSRVWRNQTVDIIAVAWNNLEELKAVVQKVIDNTALPYHLIICDNQSRREAVGPYLDDLWEKHDRVTVIHNHRNSMVGPGTNLGLAQGVSDYAIYLCAREGMSFRRGWEVPFIHAFEEQPGVGLVGSIGYSPTYLRGAQYPSGIRLFPQFRNPHFAAENPDRIFGHVQGGLFGMRRAMVDAIGGFSEAVPHDYTDVEYSYYAESLGWKLGEAPGVLALFNKSRPTLSQRFEETVMVAHPVMIEQIEAFQGVADGKLRHCNICDWFGPDFEPVSHACPHCAANPEDRSLQRWLGESNLMHRRLPALGVGLSGTMETSWAQQFQGPRPTLEAFLAHLGEKGRLPNRGESLALAAFRSDTLAATDLLVMARELRRLLTRDGIVLFQIEGRDADSWRRGRQQLVDAMGREGFVAARDATFSSSAVAFTYVPMIVFRRA